VENVYDFPLVENFGITPVDKNNCSVYNNGLAKGKYYWSLFKNLVIDLPQSAIPGLSWAEIEPSGMLEVMGIDSVGTRVFFSTGISQRKLFFTDDFTTFTEGTLSAGTGLGFSDVCAVTSTLIVAIDGYNFWISSNAGVDYTRSTKLTGLTLRRSVIEKINDTTVVVAGPIIHVINATNGTVIRSITSPGGTISSILKIDENNFVCGGFNGTNAAIFRTDNQFVSITKVDEDTSAATTEKGAVVRTDGTTLYAKMPVGKNTLIKKSVDGGTTWTLLSTVAIVSNGDFYVHSADVSVMSALNKQYISTDGHLNYVKKTTIKGMTTNVYHLLSSGNLLAGTNAPFNDALWVSVPEEP
jgi:hypothetical protein